MLPGFIIIGAMKCGTTSLYHYLKSHSQIGVSEIKETNYFIEERNYSKKVEWYKSQFKGDFRIYGEASPNYTKAHLFDGVPERMHELIPAVKLLYILRDPVDRIISHYTHNYGTGVESSSIDTLLTDEQKFNHYVMSSRYYWQIQKYLEYFPEKQILIISSDKLRTERGSTLQEIFQFLDVDNDLDKEKLNQKFGTTSQKTRKGKVARYLFDNSFMNFLKEKVSTNFKRRIRKKILPPLKKPSQIDPDLKNKLKEAVQSDVTALRSFTGKPLKEWSV